MGPYTCVPTLSLENNSWLENLGSNEPDLVENLAKKEAQVMAKKCLKKLPLAYREPLALFYLVEKIIKIKLVPGNLFMKFLRLFLVKLFLGSFNK